MPNMSLFKVEMPNENPIERSKNFKEVAKGYTEEMAMEEARRCLNCKSRPCVDLCPVNVNIPEFIMEIAKGNFLEAYNIIAKTNALPAVCGRVCPQEVQCESACVRAVKGESVAIGRLERFVADWYLDNKDKPKMFEMKEELDKKVAIIGAGPSGLSAAKDLAIKGYDVSIYEAFHEAGGVLVYGIPEFRLPKDIVKAEVEQLKDLGVKIKLNMVIGKSITVDELMEEYDAVYIASGAGLPTFMGLPGEGLVGVYSANELLTRVNLMKAYIDSYDTPIARSKRVAIIGGGNVAMDAARCAKRVGAEEVYVVYRRSENEMPARLEEVHHAKEEGVFFKTLTNPIEIIGDESGFVKGIKCVRMKLTEPDENGRATPVPIPNSEFIIDVDAVVMSIGTSPNPLIQSTTRGLEVNKKGCLVVDDSMMTTKKGVFAGGDAVSGAATVINAMGNGKAAAKGIDKMLKSI